MKSKPKVRDNFSPKIIEQLKMRAAFICSNPSCSVMTIAPAIENENQFQYIGKAAHITAAAKGGPRYDSNLASEKRTSIDNAIFLCSNCADTIDKNNGIDYRAETLKTWKKNHEDWVRSNLNKSIHKNEHVINVSSKGQSGGVTANVVNINS
jgi:hypothetical protein